MKKLRLLLPVMISAVMCMSIQGCGDSSSQKDKDSAADIAVEYVSDKYGLSFDAEKWASAAGSDDVSVTGSVEGFDGTFDLKVSYEDSSGYYVSDDYWLCEQVTQPFLQKWLDDECRKNIGFEDFFLYGDLRYPHLSDGQSIVKSMEDFTKGYESGSINTATFDFYVIISESGFKDEDDAFKNCEKLKEFIEQRYKGCKYSIVLYIFSDEQYKSLTEQGYKDYRDAEHNNIFTRSYGKGVLYESGSETKQEE